MARLRLDEAVSANAGVSRSRARSLIVAGRVRVDGRTLTKPGTTIAPGAALTVERPAPYVSRGGEKLEGALHDFGLDVRGARALDVGASTGGFTDCLLAAGAVHIVALDVGYGQLAYPLRQDPRVTVMERCNFRLAADGLFAREFDVIAIDASFISVVTMIARAKAFLREGGSIVALVKPQFEAGPARLGSGGVVRDRDVHRAILHETRDAIVHLGLMPVALTLSKLRGPAGNIEFFALLRNQGEPIDDAVIDRVLTQGDAP
ncbi:MAG TPA: TlyA family RNA methyltransferase [Candidatus Baltobacteraceae bacterium]